MAGISPSQVNRIEKGANPSIAVLSALERALGLEGGELAGPQPIQPDASGASLDQFLNSSLAAELKLTSDEIKELSQWRWFKDGEILTNADWYDFVRLRRRLSRRLD
jgi:transcriptional regulator with XRE-family HTH domain